MYSGSRTLQRRAPLYGSLRSVLMPYRPRATLLVRPNVTPLLPAGWLAGWLAGYCSRSQRCVACAATAGNQLSRIYDNDSYWWRHERLHRLILTNYRHNMRLIRPDRDRMQELFHNRVFAFCEELRQQADAVSKDDQAQWRLTSRAERLEFAERCMSDAEAAEQRWERQILRTATRAPRIWFQSLVSLGYMLEWRYGWNRAAKLPLPIEPPVLTLPKILAYVPLVVPVVVGVLDAMLGQRWL